MLILSPNSVASVVVASAPEAGKQSSLESRNSCRDG